MLTPISNKRAFCFDKMCNSCEKGMLREVDAEPVLSDIDPCENRKTSQP
jgi:hypothetical protein